MEILSPEKIRRDKMEQESLTQRRIRFLAEEETRLVKSVNSARSEIAELNSKKEILVLEIKKLEDKKTLLITK